MPLRHSLTALCTLLLATSFGLSVHAQKEESFADHVTVALDSASPEIIADKEFMHQLLDEIPRSRKPQPPQVLIKENSYILHGDLFRTSDEYALFELTKSFGFGMALRTPEGWQIQGIWKVPVVWRPKGWQPHAEDYFPFKPSDQAFELMDLSDSRAPEVVIAGVIGKYHQEFDILRFSPKDRTCKIDAGGMAKPVRVGSYARLYNMSSPRAIWDEFSYCKWIDERLTYVVSWHDETPYHENEGGPFIEVERERPDGSSEKYRISNVESNSDCETSYTLTRDEKPYAQITFVWPAPPAYSDNREETENAWLFTKLTSLPRSCFPYREAGVKHPNFEDIGKVRITGSPEAIRHISR